MNTIFLNEEIKIINKYILEYSKSKAIRKMQIQTPFILFPSQSERVSKKINKQQTTRNTCMEEG
jgi:hypothetical protein